MHETIARSESAYINDICEQGWTDEEDQDFVSVLCEPEIFELFFLFAYNRRIFSTKEGDLVDGADDLEWVRLVRAWTLGDMLKATDFKDAVVDALLQKIAHSGRKVPPALLRVVYSDAAPGSLLRQLIVDIVAVRRDTKLLKMVKQDGAWRGSKQWTDFFVDVAIALSEVKATAPKGKLLFEADGCAYHEHLVQETPCYSTKFRL